MSIKENLDKLLDSLPEAQVREVLEFAEFLNWRRDSDSWRKFGRAQLAKAYGDDEPEYGAIDREREARS